MTPRKKAKNARLKREFHINLQMFEKTFAFQNGKCYICKKAKNKDGEPLRLAVDHDHTTGQLRGLLCYECNKAVAVLRDSAERAYAAFQYLAKPPMEHLFGKIYTAPGRVGTKVRAKLLKQMKSK